MREADVEFSDDIYLLKAEDAQKLLEPPRLDRLIIRPGDVTLKPGEQATFSCQGIDQYGQPFSVSSAKWSSTGGSTNEEGLYEADKNSAGGLFTVNAEADGFEAIAEVRITKAKNGNGDPPPPPGGNLIRWEGEVPLLKWMNFYTKVLSRFASTPGLKLKVSFEVPAEGEQSQEKANEASSGLKELGLRDDVEVR
jgi:hypothetical protein